MMRRRKQVHFTLMEMLIVFLILSMGIALTGVKLKESYEEQRFSSEWQQALNQLRMAQELMLVMDADVEVRFAQDPQTKQVTCSLAVEKPVDDAWAKIVERKLVFSSIRSYEFDGAQADPLILRFTLGKMSKGQLLLSSAAKEEGGREETIDLPGYPSPIGKGLLSKEADQADDSRQLYPAEVYEKLYPEPAHAPIAGAHDQ